MAKIDFPDSPSDGDIFELWKYDSTSGTWKWDVIQSSQLITTFTASDVTDDTGSPGTVTSGGYTYYAFTGTGSITFGRDGLFDVLMIGGGAGGGAGTGSGLSSGGGGAADIRQLNNVFFEAGTVTFTVAGGGAGGTGGARGANGGNSSIGFGSFDKTHVLAMGGGGGAGGIAEERSGQSGASGGGECFDSQSQKGIGLTQFDGGTSGGSGVSGGGGGGAGAVGGNASGTTGGAGGAGTSAFATWTTAINSLMSGVTNWQTATTNGTGDIAGGGGGGGSVTGGAAGSGGGGDGATSTATPGNGVANTGSGGGGTENAATGGSGGSGLVIVRVLA